MLTDLLKKTASLIFETIKVVVISFAIILPVRYFLIQPFYVEGASMEPNFLSSEYLIIDEISYRFVEPARGEAVVMRYPRDPNQFFIKRIIGLPGESIEIVDGTVFINREPLDEPYISELNTSSSSYDRIVLADDEYFVMGDNRSNSLDSRVFGPIARKYFIGRAWIRGWPFSRLSILSAPEY